MVTDKLSLEQNKVEKSTNFALSWIYFYDELCGINHNKTRVDETDSSIPNHTRNRDQTVKSTKFTLKWIDFYEKLGKK